MATININSSEQQCKWSRDPPTTFCEIEIKLLRRVNPREPGVVGSLKTTSLLDLNIGMRRTKICRPRPLINVKDPK